MRKLLNIVYGLVLLAVTSHAGAVVLSLEPSSQIAGPGDSVSLDLVISGLGNGAPDSLGDFDIDISFDASALSFLGYTLGTSLGDVGLGEAFDGSFGDLGGGLVNLAEVSLLFPFELDALQADTFTLATLDFSVDVLAPGDSTTVDIDTVWALGDGFGLPLTVDAANSAVIRNAAVPEPSLLALVALGLTGVGFASRRRKSA